MGRSGREGSVGGFKLILNTNQTRSLFRAEVFDWAWMVKTRSFFGFAQDDKFVVEKDWMVVVMQTASGSFDCGPSVLRSG